MDETRYSETIDFAAFWRARLLHNNQHGRLDAKIDQQFWVDYAPHYDSRTGLPGSYTQTLATLQSMIEPGETLLDVGAGTGRFCLPLASQVRWITAVDHAAPMLNRLQEKAQAQGIHNLTIIEGAMEEIALPPHDVTLAAWSLYRQLDLPTTLQKLVTATRRRLLIVAGDTVSPPHRPLIEQVWGHYNEPDFPAYLWILGVMRQLALRAELQIVYETRHYTGATAHDIACQLAPTAASPEPLLRFTALLQPLLQLTPTGWQYTVTNPVAILIWTRPQPVPPEGQ